MNKWFGLPWWPDTGLLRFCGKILICPLWSVLRVETFGSSHPSIGFFYVGRYFICMYMYSALLSENLLKDCGSPVPDIWRSRTKKSCPGYSELLYSSSSHYPDRKVRQPSVYKSCVYQSLTARGMEYQYLRGPIIFCGGLGKQAASGFQYRSVFIGREAISFINGMNAIFTLGIPSPCAVFLITHIASTQHMGNGNYWLSIAMQLGYLVHVVRSSGHTLM